MDITADGAMEFFTSRRKVTTKWSMRGKRLHFVVPVCELLSGAVDEPAESDSFIDRSGCCGCVKTSQVLSLATERILMEGSDFDSELSILAALVSVLVCLCRARLNESDDCSCRLECYPRRLVCIRDMFINPNTAKAMHVHVWQLHS